MGPMLTFRYYFYHHAKKKKNGNIANALNNVGKSFLII